MIDSLQSSPLTFSCISLGGEGRGGEGKGGEGRGGRGGDGRGGKGRGGEGRRGEGRVDVTRAKPGNQLVVHICINRDDVCWRTSDIEILIQWHNRILYYAKLS